MTPLAPTAPRWQLRLLGGFALDDGQRRMTRLHSRAAVALLARLALAPQRDHGRGELAALLWPEADAATGRARLRSTLSTLKALLDDPVRGPAIQADRRVLRLAAGVIDSDVAALHRAVARRDAAAVRAAYGGELLPGFEDEWIHDERLVLAALAERAREGSAGRTAERTAEQVAEPPADATSDHLPVRSAQAPPDERLDAPPAARSQANVALPLCLTLCDGRAGPARPCGRSAPAGRLEPGLPLTPGRSFGLDAAVQQGGALVAEHRLLTLIGPGGCGKTRLAVAVARALAEPAPARGSGDAEPTDFDTVRFVPLVGCRDAGQTADALALALGLQGSGRTETQIGERLQDRRALLVADNAEQLEPDALALLARLAEQLPALHWLVTSRRPLGLVGEHLMPVPPLARADAVALYADRAAASRPDFHVHPGNAAAVAGLADLLLGLPLALELAAARVRTLPPAQLLALLSEAPDDPQARSARWRLLERRGPRAGADPRQASMHAVVDGSLALLAPGALNLLHRLAEPAGALPLPLVLTVAATVAPGEVAAHLDDLVAASLVLPCPFPGAQPAFSLSEPVRDRVRERVWDLLRDQGHPHVGADPAQAARSAWRHAVGLWAASQPPTIPLDELEAMLPLLCWTAGTLAADGQAGWILAPMLALAPAWAEREPPGQLRLALNAALATPAPESASAGDERPRGHALAAQLALRAGALDEALAHAQQAEARWPDDPAARAWARIQVARVRWRGAGDVAAARDLLDQAERDAAHHPEQRGAVLTQRATLANEIDRDPALAARLYEQALAELEAAAAAGGNAHVLRGLRYNLAITDIYAGRAQQALPVLHALREQALAAHDRLLAVQALNAQGSALDLLGRTGEALVTTAASASEAWSVLDTESALYALWNLAPLALALGHAEPAARLMGFADAFWRSRFGALSPTDRRDVARVRRGCRQALGRQAAERAWRHAAAWAPGRAVAEAAALGEAAAASAGLGPALAAYR